MMKPEPTTKLDSLDAYREHYAENLLGTWQSIEGTNHPLTSETFEFYDDFTGKICVQSMGVVSNKTYFLWQPVDKNRIRLCETLSPQLPEETTTWAEISYDFKMYQTEAREDVVLYQIGQDGFWTCPVPLAKLPL